MGAVTVLILTAVWRFIDGAGAPLRPKMLYMLIALAVLLALANWHNGLWGLWAAAFASINILIGHTAWKDWAWMPLRYSGIAAITALPFGEPYVYVFLCLLAGVMYPFLFWLDEVIKLKLPRFWYFDGAEAYCRIPAGAFILGGTIFL
jgi:hypothetical protein